MDKESIAELLGSEIDSRLSDRFNNIGLPNVDQRMKMYFGSDSGLSIISVKGKGTAVCIRGFCKSMMTEMQTNPNN